MFGRYRNDNLKTTDAAVSALRPATGRRRANRPTLMLWVGCVAIVMGITAIFVVEIRSRFLSTIEDAERTSQSFADVLAEHTARTFEAIERTLQAAATIRIDALAGRLNSQQSNDALRNLQKNAPALLAIGWTNAAGDVVAHSYKSKPVRSNIADLQHFITQRDTPDAGLFIAPLYRSVVSKEAISSVSIRLNNPDGSFAGAVTAPLDLKYFTNIYRSISLGSNDSVTLMLTDSTILTREPLPPGAIDRSYASEPLFAKFIKESNFGVSSSPSPIDGVDRIFAYRVIAGLPLVVIVAQDRAEVLAQWYSHVRSFVPMVALLVIVVLGGAGALTRRNKQLARESGLLEATLENMHQGILVVDETNRIAIYNMRAVEMLNIPEAFLAAKPRSEEVIAYQTAQGEFIGAPEAVKARILPRVTGETTNVYERTRPNGQILEIRTVPFAKGGVVRTYKDITDWKLIERELSDRERQFRLLAENATDIIARLNFDGILLYVSPSCQSILGYSSTDMRGERIMDYIYPDDIKPTQTQFAAMIASKSKAARHIEYRFRHKDGHWIWLEANPKLVLDDSGYPLEFVDVVRDITDRKALEADSLLARQEAETAAQVQAQFLATMSHELRTPLNSIIGFSGLVLDRGDLAPEARRQIGLIQTASDTLLTVVNDVLDFSKIQEGKLDLALVDFDFRRLVEDVIAIVRGSATQRGLEIDVSVDARIAQRLMGDDQRIRQVLFNFLNNAIKFTHHGRISLEATLILPESAANHIRLSVSDTGIGIPADKIGRLFQRFSQVDGSTSREYGGTGLGLAICKRLIEMMGGTIGVHSEPGRGSTFWASITLQAASDVKADHKVSPLYLTQFASARLLLAEDVDVNREIATVILQAIGYDVDAVTDGAEAVAAAQSSHYDLILMDIQMPGMDGMAATKLIRDLPKPYCNIPIIAMTANVLPSQIEQFLASGMDGHLGKPFKREQAGTVIDQFLSQRQADNLETNMTLDVDVTADQDAMALLTKLLGAARVDDLLAELAKQLTAFLAKDSTTTLPSDTSTSAHRLVASAGMLGFSHLSQQCARLEQAASGHDAYEAEHDDVKDACRAALSDIRNRFDFADDAADCSKLDALKRVLI